MNRGDTITNIAARYGVTAQEIRGWNHLSENRLSAGQQLRITSDLAPSASRAKRAGGKPGKPKSVAARTTPGSAKGGGRNGARGASASKRNGG